VVASRERQAFTSVYRGLTGQVVVRRVL